MLMLLFLHLGIGMQKEKFLEFKIKEIVDAAGPLLLQQF